MKLRALSSLIRSKRGSAAIEFALVVPVMLAFAAAIVEFGLIFKIYNGTNRMKVYIFANDKRAQALLLAVYDNLGKGASGAAVQNMDLMLGL